MKKNITRPNLMTALLTCLILASQISFAQKPDRKPEEETKPEESAAPGGIQAYPRRYTIQLHHLSEETGTKESSARFVYATFENDKYVVVCLPVDEQDKQYQDAREKCDALREDPELGHLIKSARFRRKTKEFSASEYRDGSLIWRVLSYFNVVKSYPAEIDTLIPESSEEDYERNHPEIKTDIKASETDHFIANKTVDSLSGSRSLSGEGGFTKTEIETERGWKGRGALLALGGLSTIFPAACKMGVFGHCILFERGFTNTWPDQLTHGRFNLSDHRWPDDARVKASTRVDSFAAWCDGEGQDAPSCYDYLLSENLLDLESNKSVFLNIKTLRNKNQAAGSGDGKVLIAGGGPAGLMAAIEAYINNAAQILVVEKRIEKARRQSVFIEDAIWKRLLSFVSETEYFTEDDFLEHKKLFHINNRYNDSRTKFVVPMAKLEVFLTQIAEEIAKYDKNFNILYGASFEGVVHSNTGGIKSKIRLADSKVLEVVSDYIVGADGSKSVVRSSVEIDTMTVSEDTYASIFIFRGNYSLKSFIAKDEVIVATPLLPEYNTRVLKQLKNRSKFGNGVWNPDEAKGLGWTVAGYKFGLSKLPRGRCFVDQQNIYFSFELTKRQFEYFRVRKKLLAEYAKTLASAYLRLDTDTDDIHIVDENIKGRSGIFGINLTRATQFYKEFEGTYNTRVFLLGDAAYTTHFFWGNGVNTALWQAMHFGEVIKGKGKKAPLDTFMKLSYEDADEMYKLDTQGLTWYGIPFFDGGLVKGAGPRGRKQP